jgi:hypothetical protein
MPLSSPTTRAIAFAHGAMMKQPRVMCSRINNEWKWHGKWRLCVPVYLLSVYGVLYRCPPRSTVVRCSVCACAFSMSLRSVAQATGQV